MDDRDYLQHFGVLGMKWGVRKKPEERKNRSKTTQTDDEKISKYKKIGRRVVTGVLAAAGVGAAAYAVVAHQRRSAARRAANEAMRRLEAERLREFQRQWDEVERRYQETQREIDEARRRM